MLAESAPRWSGLATNLHVRKSFRESPRFEISVPHSGEKLMQVLQVEQHNILTIHEIAGPLFRAHVIVAPVLV